MRRPKEDKTGFSARGVVPRRDALVARGPAVPATFVGEQAPNAYMHHCATSSKLTDSRQRFTHAHVSVLSSPSPCASASSSYYLGPWLIDIMHHDLPRSARKYIEPCVSLQRLFTKWLEAWTQRNGLTSGIVTMRDWSSPDSITY